MSRRPDSVMRPPSASAREHVGPRVKWDSDLKDDAAILGAYRDHFGIVLDRVPATDRAV